MRIPSLPLLAALSLLLAAALTHGQDETQASLEDRVAALQVEVATLRTDLEEARTDLETVQAFLEKSAKEAEAMRGVLDQSEEAGFTFGINPRSREILLQGWRKQLANQAKGLPKKQAPDAGEPAANSRAWPRR